MEIKKVAVIGRKLHIGNVWKIFLYQPDNLKKKRDKI